MSSSKLKGKVAEVIKLSSSIPVHLHKEILEKSKFFGKDNKSMKTVNTNVRKSYAQATSSNISNILKLKKNFPSLPAKKIEEIYRIIKNTNKVKPCLNMTTKDPLRKQVIVLISKDNVDNIMVSANKYVTNINRALKNIKSNIMINFICPENIRITIISTSVALQSDLQVIERYVKNIENIRSDNVMATTRYKVQ